MKFACLGLFLLAPTDLTLTPADLEMARQVIAKNTMSLPGLVPGSRFDNGPGPFSAADAAVLLALKYHAQTRSCIPAAALELTLAKLQDWDLHKKAAFKFWVEYCNTRDIDQSVEKPGALRSSFEWYILEKTTQKTRRANAVLKNQVQADEAWRRVMDSERRRQDRIRAREESATQTRAGYRAQWDAEEMARQIAWLLGANRTR